MAQLYGGKHVKAWHTNYPRAAITPYVAPFPSQPFHNLRNPRKPPSLLLLLSSISPTSLIHPFRTLTYTLNILTRYVTYILTPHSASDNAALAHTHQFITHGRGYSI